MEKRYGINTQGEKVVLDNGTLEEMDELGRLEYADLQRSNWEKDMCDLDAALIRAIEDMIEIIGVDKFPDAVQKTLNKRKKHRNRRPE